MALLGIQPVFGWLHHARFRKVGKRGVFSHIHIWYGRVLIIVGIIIGGLGLQLAGHNSGAWLIAYCVVAAVVAQFYIASIIVGVFRRRKETRSESVEGGSVTQITRDS